MSMPSGPGTYLLIIRAEAPLLVQAGALGRLSLPAGWWMYVGSALGGLRGRLQRHLRRDKRLHWHIDYVLAWASIDWIWWSEGVMRRECGWAAALATVPRVCPGPRGFGASDCRCSTHLFSAELPLARPELVEALGVKDLGGISPATVLTSRPPGGTFPT